MANTISRMLNNQFWNLTFKTGIYDFVVMSSYDDSLKSIVKAADITSENNVMDVGCGSGRLLKHIGSILKETNSKWIGLEPTSGGIDACRHRIGDMGLEERACVLTADMCKPLPVEKESIDVAIAHFSMYVIPDREKRIAAFKHIADAVKENGKIYIALPGKNYNAKDQVRSSINIIKNNKEISFIKKLVNIALYSTIGHISENMVAKRIKDGVWCGFSRDEIRMEASQAGLKMDWVKDVHGNTSLMVALSK